MNGIFMIPLLVIGLSRPIAAFYPYKLIHNASHAITLTPDEWAKEFHCDQEFLANETINKRPPPLECNRDKNAWIYKHVDELQGEFRFLVHQDSIDARFADSVYLTNGHTGLDFHHYKFNSGDPKQDELNRRMAAGSEVDNEKCARHLRQMIHLADDLSARVDQMRRHRNELPAVGLEEQHFRLARVLDSFGRYESGQFGGRYHSFGLYDQCISTPLLLGENDNDHQGLVGSRYCWARLNIDRHLSKPLRGAQHCNSSQITSYFPGDFKFHMAICLPRSCHSVSFDNSSSGQNNIRIVQQLVDSQYKMPKSMYMDESLPIEAVFCLVDDDSQIARMGWGGRLFIGFALLWMLLCIIATYKRRAKHVPARRVNGPNSNRGQSFWTHLDLFESWCDFLGQREISRQGNRVNLDPLNFVKCFCTLLVVMSHATVLSGPLTLAHIRLAAIMETNRLESLSLFGFVLVDSFFVITGMMMTYIFLKRISAYERRERAKLELTLPPAITANIGAKSSIVVDFEREFSPLGKGFHMACTALTLSRYLRLVPLFFLVFWFKKSVYPHLGSGPMWDYGLNMNTTIGGCLQETWLTPLTFLSAYLPSAQQCLPQTWTISNDIFFSLITPPIMVLLYKWPRSAVALTALNLVVAFYLGQLTYDQLDARARFEIEQLRDHSVVILFQLASYIYTLPLYRMPAILVGTLTGYALFKYAQRGLDAKSVSLSPNEPDQNGDRTLTATENFGEARPADQWPWWFRGPATYVSLSIVAMIFISSLLTPEFRKSASQELRRSMVTYMLLYYHLIWSLANAVLLLRLVTDLNDHFVFRLFASKFFSITGKLSYAILLVHWDLLMYDLHIETQAPEFSRWNYFGAMSMAYCASIPIAIVLFVVFENPLDKLTKTYLLKFPQLQSTTTTTATTTTTDCLLTKRPITRLEIHEQ
jgi:peptidoglycan/LPS O-acetylase OafA/YrhL